MYYSRSAICFCLSFSLLLALPSDVCENRDHDSQVRKRWMLEEREGGMNSRSAGSSRVRRENEKRMTGHTIPKQRSASSFSSSFPPFTPILIPIHNFAVFSFPASLLLCLFDSLTHRAAPMNVIAATAPGKASSFLILSVILLLFSVCRFSLWLAREMTLGREDQEMQHNLPLSHCHLLLPVLFYWRARKARRRPCVREESIVAPASAEEIKQLFACLLLLPPQESPSSHMVEMMVRCSMCCRRKRERAEYMLCAAVIKGLQIQTWKMTFFLPFSGSPSFTVSRPFRVQTSTSTFASFWCCIEKWARNHLSLSCVPSTFRSLAETTRPALFGSQRQ